MSLKEIIEASRRYGADRDFVVAGGGNTSWKNGKELYIKGSGAALETIDETGFVRMDREKLAAIWRKDYPADSEARESAVLADLMAARAAGEEAKRPSVETLLHDILPYAFVVHTHPALVNAVTCSVREERAAKELFGDEALWIPSTNPGYILSLIVKDAYEQHRVRTGKNPAFILLQNHGIFVAADSIAEVDAVYRRVFAAISAKIVRKPDFSPTTETAASAAARTELSSTLSALAASDGASGAVHFAANAETLRLVADAESFAALRLPFSPDHIVYAGSDFLFVEGATPSAVKLAWDAFVSARKRNPKLVAVRGLGVFGVGANEKSARLATELFMDAAKIACYTESFGGSRFMTPDQIDFINNWEVERYRSKISTAK